jgi:4,5:9,10-diseco-3-hydroxy-5,9,17-trioxoandrosta-1(10),2-diene-4-oate hydrolase
MNERTIDAGGVSFLVRSAGDGDPVLLLHGFPQTGDCWRSVAGRLARHHRVIVPDLPGFGRSSSPPSYDAAAVAGTLAALLDAVDAPRATIVGHDWGGSLSFAFALAHPDRVERLVVTNAPFRKLDLKRGFHFLVFNVPVLPEVAFRVAGDRLVTFMLRAGSARKEVMHDDAVQPYVEALRNSANVSSAMSYYRTVTRTVIARRFRKPAPADGAPRRIKAPTLIVWGMRDPALPASVLESIVHDIPQAKVVRLEDVGHFVPDEAPEELATAIEGFIANG